jgi:hypothetical protein
VWAMTGDIKKKGSRSPQQATAFLFCPPKGLSLVSLQLLVLRAYPSRFLPIASPPPHQPGENRSGIECAGPSTQRFEVVTCSPLVSRAFQLRHVAGSTASLYGSKYFVPPREPLSRIVINHEIEGADHSHKKDLGPRCPPSPTNP